MQFRLFYYKVYVSKFNYWKVELSARLNFSELKLLSLIKLQAMKEITVEQLKQKMDNNEPFQIIDVREDFEYEMSNLNGVNIPLAGILLEAEKISKDIPVVVQCRSGKRSAMAIMQLEHHFGLENLYNLQGGIMAWKEAYDPSMQVY